MTAFIQKVFSKCSYVTAHYYPDDNNTFAPAKVTRCPHSSPEKNCIIHRKGQRDRKCGPGFRLTRLVCETHQKSFTVYPPGWIPFGRRKWLPFSEDGSYNKEEKQKTYFRCVFDLLNKKRWGETATNDYPARRTQERHIEAIARMLSLTSDDDNEIHKTSLLMKVETQHIRDHASSIRDGPNLMAKAEGVGAVLSGGWARGDLCFENILQLGQNHNFWGLII